MKVKIVLISIISLIIFPAKGHSQAISEYLILTDIGPYKLSQPKKLIPGMAPVGGPRVGNNAGIVGTHFPDHVDTTYEVMYLGPENYPSPTVTVTQHAGVDSDKWLLHEIEDIYRDNSKERLGMLSQGAFIRPIGSYKIFSHGIGGGGYTWFSNNNVVVDIRYTSLQVGKPKPTEIVQAYLAKFPSIIPTTFKWSSAHDVEWIKEEIDRRLWLCDKWTMLIQPGDTALYDKLDSIVRNMNIFLDYREKYFGLNAKIEKQYLISYLSKKDEVTLKTKLSEYKAWWAAHKTDSITLP